MIDLDRLLKLRLVVARFGEMDGAKWWNTNGLLGKPGASAVSRGLPKSHPFARARAVFAVARARCREIYNLAGSITLWELPPEIEIAFEDGWSSWVEGAGGMTDVFTAIQDRHADRDLLGVMQANGCLTAGDIEAAKHLKRAADQRAVPVGAVAELTDSVVTLLAAGFHRGDVGSLAVPYARIEGEK